MLLLVLVGNIRSRGNTDDLAVYCYCYRMYDMLDIAAVVVVVVDCNSSCCWG